MRFVAVVSFGNVENEVSISGYGDIPWPVDEGTLVFPGAGNQVLRIVKFSLYSFVMYMISHYFISNGLDTSPLFKLMGGGFFLTYIV